MRVYGVTYNPENSDIQESISQNSNLDIVMATPKLVGPLYQFTWMYRELSRRDFEEEAVSRFLYLEDAICLGRENPKHFLRSEEGLRRFGRTPGCLRSEENKSGRRLAADVSKVDSLELLPRVIKSLDCGWLNLRYTNQGKYP